MGRDSRESGDDEASSKVSPSDNIVEEPDIALKLSRNHKITISDHLFSPVSLFNVHLGQKDDMLEYRDPVLVIGS